MNIFENDTISVKGKKQAAEHIIKRYGNFGWKLTEQKDDKLYGDVTHMTFIRPHFIENKDELQLLQVRLEIAYNKTGKLAHKSTLRALLWGNFFGLLAIAFAVGGVLLIMLLGGVVDIAIGSVLCFLGVLSGVVGGITGYLVFKKDKKKYGALIEKEVEKIENICSDARRLRGEDE